VIVVDTGVLVAAVNRRDKFHTSCAAFLDRATEVLVVPAMVVTEVCYMLARPLNGGSPKLAATFLDALATESLTVEAPSTRDFARIAELVRRYADLPLDAVDAAVIATAERLGTGRVATVDRKDFRIIVPAHRDTFELLPADLERS
jgi:predicted nucleic acid-binding protein